MVIHCMSVDSRQPRNARYARFLSQVANNTFSIRACDYITMTKAQSIQFSCAQCWYCNIVFFFGIMPLDHYFHRFDEAESFREYKDKKMCA